MPRTWIALSAIIATAGLRLLWLADMEFNPDQVQTMGALAAFRFWPLSALAPAVSAHSGVAHSAGFYFWLNVLTFGSTEPMGVAAAIAKFNALPIVVGIWLFRRDRALLAAFSLMGVATPLVVLSRHVWTPDPVAGWVSLSILLFCLAAERGSARLAFFSALSLWMAPHMYLAAMAVTVVVSVWVLVFGGLGRAWLAGCVAGALSFVPLAIALLTGGAGASAPRTAALHFGADQVGRVLKDAVTLTTPVHVFSRYLGGHLGLLDEAGRTAALVCAVVTMGLASLVGVALFGGAIASILRRWREMDPLTRLAPVLVVATGVSMFTAGLGTFIHYWIAVVPFACVAIARAFATRPRWLWTYVALSAAASFSFFWLVHERGGLPGAYGPSYRVRQVTAVP